MILVHFVFPGWWFADKCHELKPAVVFVGFFRTGTSCDGMSLDETLGTVDCCWLLSVDS